MTCGNHHPLAACICGPLGRLPRLPRRPPPPPPHSPARAQAVVVSIDPRRVYVNSPQDTPHLTVETSKPGVCIGLLPPPSSSGALLPPHPRACVAESPQPPSHSHVSSTGPNGERFCWWQCTIKGGREGRDVDAVQLAQAVEGEGGGGGAHGAVVRPLWAWQSSPPGTPGHQSPEPPLPPLRLPPQTWELARSCSIASTTTAWAKALTLSWSRQCLVRREAGGGEGGGGGRGWLWGFTPHARLSWWWCPSISRASPTRAPARRPFLLRRCRHHPRDRKQRRWLPRAL